MLLRRLSAFLFLMALAVPPAKAQSRQVVFSLGGFIRDESGQQAMENILVTLKQSTGIPMSTTNTRGNGEFQFDGLSNGEYILEINVQDYEPVRETISISGASRVGFSIFLVRARKAANPVNPGLQLAISTHQLSVPHKARDEFEKGMSLLYLQSDSRAAIAQFQLAIKDFPAYYEAYSEEGGAYFRLEQMEPAEAALRKSIDLSSGKYADASFTLAGLLTDTKRYDEAAASARRGIADDATSWRGPFELARALTALKQIDEAETYAQQARNLMPDNPPVYLLLANIHIQRRDYSSLVKDLDQYLLLAPNSPAADQARKTRARVQSLLDDSDDESSDKEAAKPETNAEHAHPATGKE
jgi:tetratricopeptide (TPR) repeat protein